MKKFGLLMIFMGGVVFGQEHLSGFNSMSLTYKMTPKWTLNTEIQSRARKDYSLIDYYEIKGGVGYNYIKNHQLYIGLGRFATYESRLISQEEFRIWAQYNFNHKINRFKIDHRARAEKRYFYAPQTEEHTNAIRYRYRLSGTYPINNSKVIADTYFINVYNEVFLGVKEPNFKRNRLFTGGGYQFNDWMSTTVGYMWQREFSTKGNSNYHFLYFSLNFTIDHSEDEKDFHVPMLD